MRRIVTVASGAALTVALGGCPNHKNGAAVNPPEIGGGTEQQEGPTDRAEDTNLPVWDDVPSRHPVGATNPPIPELLVTPDGRCFKNWHSPMVPGPRGDRVVDSCDDDRCGTEISCPERATDIPRGED